MDLYYLGLKRKTIQHNTFFKSAIVISGGLEQNGDINFNNLYNYEVDYNLLSNFSVISQYYSKAIDYILSKNNNAKFMLYNQAAIEFMDSLDNVICYNDIELIKNLNDKPTCRNLLKNEIKVLEYKYLYGNQISFNKVNKMFNCEFEKYVVQQPVGFAGVGTFLITKDNSKTIVKQLNPNILYSVSGYIESISVNNTFIISNNHIHIFEGSQQLIVANKELSYDGWDFDGYENLNESIKANVYNETTKIAKKLQSLGYRGIGGVDYIINNDNVYFMEINPRFQASSEYLDKMLISLGFSSIFELNYFAFYNESEFIKISKKLENYYNKR